ncbi:MAG TPA: DUF2007 domain-containing protein [Bacteroidales bacterium]|nr:DUF2007 domain-containing protein [Bacteroidales bacterium]
MKNDWVLIYETDKNFEIEIIRGMLEEHGIDAVIVNKKDSVYLIGNFELYVSSDDLMLAKTLIMNFNS